ncbi:uncharacterized protein LOC141560379 [Sminthopsis crassicaudata]|uniref:uncharacterized protein LOC141560379 n=1 Tax=Sminthopsis crassicaudata TaxID=9301 RepID=UPI003D695EC6
MRRSGPRHRIFALYLENIQQPSDLRSQGHNIPVSSPRKERNAGGPWWMRHLGFDIPPKALALLLILINPPPRSASRAETTHRAPNRNSKVHPIFTNDSETSPKAVPNALTSTIRPPELCSEKAGPNHPEKFSAFKKLRSKEETALSPLSNSTPLDPVFRLRDTSTPKCVRKLAAEMLQEEWSCPENANPPSPIRTSAINIRPKVQPISNPVSSTIPECSYKDDSEMILGECSKQQKSTLSRLAKLITTQKRRGKVNPAFVIHSHSSQTTQGGHSG